MLSALSAFETRIKIKTNKTVRLSKSGPLSCAIYNQGCNGGYPELVYKYGMEKGFYQQDCEESLKSSNNIEITDNLCLNNCYDSNSNQKPVWKVSSYGYVSQNKSHSFYGSSNEEAMKLEIFNNGPIVVALNASPDLYYYSSGVFVTNPKNPLVEDNDNLFLKSWMFTNHAVVCVGWGELLHNSQLLKYWILKNSWG